MFKAGRLLSLLLLALALTGCVSIPKLMYNVPGNAPLSVTLKDGRQLKYMQYIPPNADTTKKMPLIILLHGSGEAGDDPYAVLANGPWRYAATHPDFPFIILGPQMPRDGEWRPDQLEDWLQQVEKTVPVDKRRIYLTGLSRGGQGTWDFAMRYPHHFAAIAPISGYSDINQPCRLKGLPVWAFHGANDTTVPVEWERFMVEAAKACGVKVRYTVYPDTGHDAWTRTYADPALYAWLMDHKRSMFILP